MDYNGLNAKIKAMEKNLLSYDDYTALCKINSVYELGQKLKELPAYKSAMEGLSDAELTRNPIERKIVLSISDDFSRIYSFITDFRLRKFLDAYFLKDGIHIVKLLLCSIFDERDATYSLPEANNMLSRKIFSNLVGITKLKSSKTVPELIEALKETELHSVLSSVYTEGSTLFELEMRLDLYYYLNLWREKDKYLLGENKKAVTDIIGTEIDLLNLAWLYRLKVFYNIATDKQILTYLIPIKHRLKMPSISAMVAAKTREELSAEILKTPYGKYIVETDKPEKSLNKEMIRALRKTCMTSSNSLATTLNYIYLKTIEQKNIVSLLEGIRYSLGHEDILKYLMLNQFKGVKQ